MYYSIVSLVIFILMTVQQPVEAAFTGRGTGARPVGMGAAFTAIADDANAVYWNPGGSAYVKRHSFTSMYSKLFKKVDAENIGYHYLAYLHPTLRGTFGAGGIIYDVGVYHERTLLLTYGRKFFKERLGAGINLKGHQLSVKSAYDDPVFSNGKYSKTDAGVDIGIIYKPYPFLNVGLMIRDIGITRFKGADEKLPIEVRGGMALNIISKINAAVDISYRRDSVRIYSGLEYWMLDGKFALRGGIYEKTPAVGASARFHGDRIIIGLDYAYTIHEQLGDSHRASLSVQF